jgi:hypothetical protein
MRSTFFLVNVIASILLWRCQQEDILDVDLQRLAS